MKKTTTARIRNLELGKSTIQRRADNLLVDNKTLQAENKKLIIDNDRLEDEISSSNKNLQTQKSTKQHLKKNYPI